MNDVRKNQLLVLDFVGGQLAELERSTDPREIETILGNVKRVADAAWKHVRGENAKLGIARPVVGMLVALALLVAPVRAWEFRDNPDRFPSVGLHVDNLKLGGERTETVFNNAGVEVPYRHSDETEFGWRGGLDLRVPTSQSLTFTLSYDHVETDDYFTRHNEIGGDMYKEHRAMTGYSYGVGVRLYLNQ